MDRLTSLQALDEYIEEQGEGLLAINLTAYEYQEIYSEMVREGHLPEYGDVDWVVPGTLLAWRGVMLRNADPGIIHVDRFRDPDGEKARYYKNRGMSEETW